jgi:hypothetical protein
MTFIGRKLGESKMEPQTLGRDRPLRFISDDILNLLGDLLIYFRRVVLVLFFRSRSAYSLSSFS